MRAKLTLEPVFRKKECKKRSSVSVINFVSLLLKVQIIYARKILKNLHSKKTSKQQTRFRGLCSYFLVKIPLDNKTFT